MCLLRIVFIGIFMIANIYPVFAQDNYEIRHINFHGNKTLDKQFLLDAMSLKEVSFLEKLITKQERPLYNQEMISMDMQRLKRTYQSEGFLNVKTTLQPLSINEKRQNVTLNIDIKEGKPVLVDTITFQFNKKAIHFNTDSLVKRLQRKLTLKKGKRFRDADLNSDISIIENALKSLGYAYVKVDYHLNLDLKKFKTGIQYSIHAGPKSYVGKTQISGNKHVSEAFIRKQLRYKKGQLYNQSLLDKTRQSLYQLQLFRVVSVLPQTNPETQKNPIDVKINVDEAPRMTTRFGAGYGTEDKFRAFVDFTYLGFLGTARRINLYAKHSALEPYYVSFKWTQPQIFDKKGSISLNPFISRNAEPGYNTKTYGINIPVSYNFNSRLSSTLTYYLENVKQKIEPGDPEFTNSESRNFPYGKSGLLYSSVFSTASPQFSPQKGVNLSLGFKYNGYFLGGDFNYTRLWIDARTYQKIGDWVLALRLMAGGIHSSDKNGFIPVEDRFYSGGSTSNRGWRRSELGPKRESGSPLGGKSIIETNIEFRYPLFWKISGVVFMDAGNVWKGSYHYRLAELEYAAGGGLRVDTPIGPVRFDVGVPVWNAKKTPQFFISVGQAF